MVLLFMLKELKSIPVSYDGGIVTFYSEGVMIYDGKVHIHYSNDTTDTRCQGDAPHVTDEKLLLALFKTADKMYAKYIKDALAKRDVATLSRIADFRVAQKRMGKGKRGV